MEKLLTTKEVAAVLICHTQSVYRNKGLPYINVPGIGKRYRASDIYKLLEENTFTPTSVLTHQNTPNSFKLTKLAEIDKLYLSNNKGGNSESMSRTRIRWNYSFGSIYIRKTKQGLVRWYIDYQVDGKRIREVVKNAQSRAEAVLHLREKCLEAFNSLHSSNKIEKPIDFTELSECYVRDYAKQNKKTWKNDVRCLEASLKPFFGRFKLKEISPHHIEKYRAVRLETGVTKATVNRELALMKKMFNLAIDWELAGSNPVKKIKFFSEKDNQKERILSKKEEDTLLKISPDHLRSILTVALNTGMRKSEILNLKWEQVDMKKKLIKVENTKSGRSRHIDINTVLTSLLPGLKRKNKESEFVFPNPDTGKPYVDLKKAFKTACDEAGIGELRFHDLRHTFASRLVENGVDLITVKDLLGHSTVKVTERYTHPNKSLKRKAVESLVQDPEKARKTVEFLAHEWH
ncbi:MAG: tyrosine-type recombinase/integrase, partial [Candidatus Aminicenantaceae bacterium]